MKTFSISMISLMAMTGLAFAQAKQADPKAGGAATATVAPPAKMEMPKPPAEVAAALKAMGRAHRCTGSGIGPDMKTEVKFKGQDSSRLELDGWWIHGSMTGTMGEGKTAGKMKMESYMTYDTKLAKWRTLGVMNDGTQMVGTADMKDGKWEGSSTMTGPMGDGMFREHGDMTDKKVGMKMWGEMSMDKGKTWMKVYEMTCK